MILTILFTMLTLLAIVVGLLCITWYIIYFKYEKYLKDIPGPPVFPIIGSAHHVKAERELLPTLMTCHEKYGDIVKFMFGYLPKILIFGQKEIEFLLSSTTILDKSYEYNFIKPWVGMGLLTSSGAEWKHRRKMLNPAFHFTMLENFIKVFERQSNILIDKLEEHKKEPVNIFPLIGLLALDILCETSMNTTINAQTDSSSEYVRCVKQMARIGILRTFSAFKYSDFLFKLTKEYNVQKDALKILHGFTDSIIKKRKNKLEKQNFVINENNDNKKKSVLDILLKSENPLPDYAIREEVDTFTFAGHDTITTTLSFTLYCLSKYQLIQEKVIQELLLVDKDKGNKPLSYIDLSKLKYLEQVIKETMRLYPPVALFGRTLTEDVDFDGRILPKNMSILIFNYALHRQESIYENPETFNPDRFSPENSKYRSIYSYIPFSAGPRNCIGQKFAMLEMKYVIAKILKKFKLLPVVEHRPDIVVHGLLFSNNGLPIRLEERDHK